ncbi:TetR/AcrR family transcriptional regulator [Providencia stuartii]|uniref:TetR family transcriptional regulator n=1 Tax=Providencia stuartii TaxID=588 RepID=A0A1S1HS95_PROST|nr:MULTISPECIES: TetR/AcrR family transcriptional regulator [Providencia]MDV5227023.1 TetR/AcrR family transcriptional regulator [Providencia rettgeri]ELR5113727.1 TetR/AcrR family transcriptional regulator [Providencia stuartii]ELR5301047.1 TetR/AcrR family transcriptional regulator [Providencia stuartii]MDW7589456.1 TetR/AcrR family transcriptional regulator [Providencia sp. 2023EL-00965]OHT24256.1 TetR family transcriptional regulator [Providencia stuartii]
MSAQTERQKAKKKQIIDAAISCFIEKGFHATSTAEICKAAGMSPGNLFHYYPTKYAIIEAIAIEDQLYFEQILNSVEEASSSIESVILMMTRLIELYNDPDYARISIEIFAEASRNPEINRIFVENDKKLRDKLTALIIEGRNKGEIDLQLHPENTASWLMTTADGTIGRELMDPEFNWQKSLDAFIFMIKKTLST